MVLTPEEQASIEERFEALEETTKRLEQRLRSNFRDNRIPLLATGFDIEDAIFPPAAHIYNADAISTSNGSLRLLGFDSERYDTDEMHSTSSNTARFTIKVAGIYTISANTEWAASPTSGLIRIRLNGSTVIAASRIILADYRIMNVTVDYPLVVGDYVEVQVLQNSGGGLNINATGNYSPTFMIKWIGLIQ